MIQPLAGEEEWRNALNGLAEWKLPEMRTIVVSPHPDDETLGAGGLIAAQRRRGCEVIVVAVTDGENAYPDDHDEDALAATRREEQAAAVARLGVSSESLLRLGLIDSAVSAQEADLLDRLLEVCTGSTLLVAPWEGDFHPDHEACGRAALEVVRRTGGELASYFFWSWHRGTPEVLEGLDLVSLPLNGEMQQAKLEALALHRSQLLREDGEPVLPEELLGPARRSFEVFAIR